MTEPPARLVEDIAELRAAGLQVELDSDAARFYVIIRSFALPAAYEPNVVDVMVMTDYQYPLSALDMFWTEPHVRCCSGGWPANADQFSDFAGRTWQRWSYHYPGWDPVRHSLLTHLGVFQARLAAAS
jgi:hypothetical protein